ncbi:MAG: arginine--tRNA ligase, partial [Chloroflexota bacterium]|nr:arginine--tRNA ligase [Chloroflexota bacterium]
MTPEQLALAIRAALVEAVAAGDLAVDVPDEVRIERPRNREHGDWSTNVSLQIAKAAGMPPREIATRLATRLAALEGVKAVDIAGPGFLNITLEAATAGELARTIVEAGPAYGRGDAVAGHRINLEFVSSNPTGPIHLGSTRWAAVGDALARIFEFSGADVTREYYFNDHGAQIDRFARSLLAAAKGDPAPEDGYAGAYINDIASAVMEHESGILDLPDPQAQERFRALGVDLMFTEIKQSMHNFGVEFDVYFHENTLHESGAVERAVARLTELGVMYEKDGATWLRTTDYGDDKDRVVIKSDGKPAYISGDLAYYLNKRERGFDRVFIMLGADHHGYVSRMMAMCAAFGDIPHENLEILIGQMVNLIKDGTPVRMSKRAGTVVVLEDLVEAVGVDAARYALTRSSIDSMIDIDLDLWAKAGSDNPVYYVQYAHSRNCSLLENGRQLGLEPSVDTF